MKKVFFIIAVLILKGCDTYDDLSGMFEKPQQVEKYIKQKHGYDTQVGFNISNGVLIQVTVYFQSADVRSVSVGELENIALTAVARFFKLTPKMLNVVIQSAPDEEKYKNLQSSLPHEKYQSGKNVR